MCVAIHQIGNIDAACCLQLISSSSWALSFPISCQLWTERLTNDDPPLIKELARHKKCRHTFNTFVGGKLLGPTFLGSPTVRTVGVGVTFSLLGQQNTGKSGTEIVGPTKGKMYLQHFSEPESVGTTKELQQMGHNYLQHQQFSSVERKNCRSNKRCESGSNK